MASWDEALTEFLKPFVALLGHKKRRQMCPLYVAGLGVMFVACRSAA